MKRILADWSTLLSTLRNILMTSSGIVDSEITSSLSKVILSFLPIPWIIVITRSVSFDDISELLGSPMDI